jgi:hypothetical protein
MAGRIANEPKDPPFLGGSDEGSTSYFLLNYKSAQRGGNLRSNHEEGFSNEL